jgi:hypothetical protein
MPFDQVVEAALQLSVVEQARLMKRQAAAMQESLQDSPSEEVAWTDEELIALRNSVPMTGAEIVAAGLLGGWSDEGIEDGAAWVNERKQQRKARNLKHFTPLLGSLVVKPF